MNDNNPLALAAKIEQAVKKSSLKGKVNGVFVCTDPDKNIYEFIPLSDMVVDNKKTLSETLSALAKNIQGAKTDLVLLSKDFSTLKKSLEESFNNALKEMQAREDLIASIQKQVLFNIYHAAFMLYMADVMAGKIDVDDEFSDISAAMQSGNLAYLKANATFMPYITKATAKE